MSNHPSNSDLEQDLRQLFPEPGAAFVSRLEQQLTRETGGRTAGRRPRLLAQPRGRLAAAGLAALVVILLVAVGPRDVVAAVQKLIGYVPGIGFMENPSGTLRVLAGPVQAEREGITVTVEKALAEAESTQIRVRVDGVAQDKSLFEPGWGESSHPLLREQNPDGSEGETFAAGGSVSGAGEFIWAEYTFPALSSEVERVTLLLDRLPGLKAGVAPQDWTIELPLVAAQPGDGVVIASAEPRASTVAGGGRLVLESVAAAGEQTALKLRLASDNSLRQAGSLWWEGLVLTDETGQELPLVYERPLEGLRDGSTVMLAPALEPGRRYKLALERSEFEYRFDTFGRVPTVRVPVPAGAQAGQTWAVDETLEAAGFALHITQAELVTGAVQGLGLRLTIDPQPGLVGVGLNCKDYEVCASSGFELSEPGQPLETDVYLDRTPGRWIDLQVQMLLEAAQGPWVVEFEG